MLEKIRGITNKKYFHIVMLIFIITSILFITGMMILKYNVEGESNMPFKLSKISVVSSSGGIDRDLGEAKWEFNVYQSNDIYIYISKNKNYQKTETIKSVNIENIKIDPEDNKNIKIYRPDDKEEKVIFKNTDEDIVEKIEYLGDMESNLKNLKISNQGGIVAFRCSNNNLAEYNSEDDEINHYELLKKAKINNEDLQMKIKFDLIINLESGKKFQTNINLELPIGDVVDKGNTSTEITDVGDFIFKRINN